MNPKDKILIAVPTMGSIHTILVAIILKWIAEASTGAYNLSFYPTVNVQPVDNARNHIVEVFLQSDCTHLFFIDSDTIPPENALKKLLSADKDIVSALTPIIEHDPNRKNDSKGYYRKYNVVSMADKHVNEYIGLVPVKGAGSACIMIKRKVFEMMTPPYYRFQYQDDNGKPIIVGEDILFTIKAMELGFQPFSDTSIICQHEKSIPW